MQLISNISVLQCVVGNRGRHYHFSSNCSIIDQTVFALSSVSACEYDWCTYMVVKFQFND